MKHGALSVLLPWLERTFGPGVQFFVCDEPWNALYYVKLYSERFDLVKNGRPIPAVDLRGDRTSVITTIADAFEELELPWKQCMFYLEYGAELWERAMVEKLERGMAGLESERR